MLAATASLFLVLLAGLEQPYVPGEYYLGDGTGVNWTLNLNPDGTFDFAWDGCVGRYDEKSGTWCLVDGVIRLDVVREKPDGMVASLPASLRPIVWGERLYLVSDRELTDFCNDINTGEEPRSESFGGRFLRVEDWFLPAPSRPAVPESVRDLILDAPVRGMLIGRLTDQTGTIDRGRSSGLRPGMVLYLQKAFELISYRVIAVSESTSEVRMEIGDRIVEGPVSTLIWDEPLRAANRD